MTELIKQRLLGMLIVVIAGVVFLPDLLDGQKQLTKEEFRKIPMKPELAEQPVITEFPKEQVIKAMEQTPTLADDKALDVESVEAVQAETEKAEQNEIENEVAAAPTENAENDNTVEVVVAQPVEKQTQSSPAQVKTSFEKPMWVVRLGSFRHKANVDNLISKLNEAGFKTFVKPIEAKAGILHRVVIGPEQDKQKLQSELPKIKELTRLDAKVIPFDPIN